MNNFRNLEQNKQNENPIQKYIMIRQPLDKIFNQVQFQQIKNNKPSSHIRLQYKILNNLIKNQEIFVKYFSIFYENHVKLYHWYLLSREKHHQIQGYLFKKLLKKEQQSYRDEMKSYQLKLARQKERQKQQKSKAKSREQLLALGQNFHRYKLDDLSNEIFNFMTTKTATASLLTTQKPWAFNKAKKHLRQNSLGSQNSDILNHCQENNKKILSVTTQGFANRKSQMPKNKDECMKKIHSTSIRNHDFHDLYIQTFHACDGPRYIFYDYQKHMKGLNEKDKYNMFIRRHNKSKDKNLRLTQLPQKEPIFKQIKSYSRDLQSTTFQYPPFGKVTQSTYKKKSKVVFRKTRTKNGGKFIRT